MTQISPFLLQLLQAQGGSGGGMQSNAPQIPIAQRSSGSNISPAPQMQQQRPQQQVGAATGTNNLFQTALSGQKLYNSTFGNAPQAQQTMGQQSMGAVNPNAAQGSPVANNPAGNAYLNQNPQMQGSMSSLPQGMNAPQSGYQTPANFMQPANSTQPYAQGFGQPGSAPGAMSYNTPGQYGNFGSTPGMTGQTTNPSAGFNGQGTNSGYGMSGWGAADTGATAGGADGAAGGSSAAADGASTDAAGSAGADSTAGSSAADSSWLDQLWQYL